MSSYVAAQRAKEASAALEKNTDLIGEERDKIKKGLDEILSGKSTGTDHQKLDWLNHIGRVMGDKKRAGDQTRVAVKEAHDLLGTQVNSRLQQVRVNSFLGSIGMQKASTGAA